MLSTAKYFKTKADYISFKPHRKVSCQQVLIGTAKCVFLRFCAEALIMSWGYMTQDFGWHDEKFAMWPLTCSQATKVQTQQLTRIVFHRRRRIFLIGKWGQLPAQYFKIISSKRIGSSSSPPKGWPEKKKKVFKKYVTSTTNTGCITMWNLQECTIIFLSTFSWSSSEAFFNQLANLVMNKGGMFLGKL